jgi:hypothetical protein
LPILQIPLLKVGLGSVGQEHLPRFLEIGARLVECRGRPVPVLARVTARIKAACPFPRIGIVRIAGATRDGADVNCIKGAVAIVDVPAVGAFGVAAAGEGGHDGI